MAETTGLLNRRTGHSVPRVRISSSPQPLWDHAAGCASSWLFLLYGGGQARLADVGQRKQARGPKDRRRHCPKGCPDPRGRPRDAASAAPRNLVLAHSIHTKSLCHPFCGDDMISILLTIFLKEILLFCLQSLLFYWNPPRRKINIGKNLL